jgi:Sortase and related acyltransferases
MLMAMKLRLAEMEDLPQIQAVYREIVTNMHVGGLRIWDEVYPCAFFGGDIEQKRLYVLLDNDVVVSAFALCDAHAGAQCVTWAGEDAGVRYLDRFGVNVHYARRGIGSHVLRLAVGCAREQGARSLRLFVVDDNVPAIHFYLKNRFVRAGGCYEEVVDDELVLHEFGFEVAT